MKSVAVSVVAVAVAVFALEMVEKKYRVIEGMQQRAPAPASRAGNEAPAEVLYGFHPHDPSTWLEAREQLLEKGADPDTLRIDFVDDVFANVPEDELRVHKTRNGGLVKFEITRGGNMFQFGGPIGAELRPGLVWRTLAHDEKTGGKLWDSFATLNEKGMRYTKGDDKADSAFVFTGCSFTFGLYLNDHETLPWYFSEGRGFKDKVVNAGMNGAGPHHSLRDFDLEYRLQKAGVGRDQVKMVVYSYIEDHLQRVRRPAPPGSPRYKLVGGKPAFQGTFEESFGRLGLLLSRSRAFSLAYNRAVGIGESDEELALALIDELHKLCLERYGIPLYVVDWVEEKGFADKLSAMGVVVVPITDAFGTDWRLETVKYFIADGHPSPYANRCIARHLLELYDRSHGG